MSAAEEVRSGKAVELELEEVPLFIPRLGVKAESPILDASDPPAGMSICGLLSGLEELPFLE